MSQYMNLKLSSIINVLCNSLMSNLAAPLPILLKVFTKLLTGLEVSFIGILHHSHLPHC